MEAKRLSKKTRLKLTLKAGELDSVLEGVLG